MIQQPNGQQHEHLATICTTFCCFLYKPVYLLTSTSQVDVASFTNLFTYLPLQAELMKAQGTLREMTMKRSNTDEEPAGPSATKT